MAFFGTGKKVDAQRKTLRFGLVAWPTNLDPRDVQDSTTLVVLTQIFEKPLKISPTSGEPEPALLKELPRPATLPNGKQSWKATVRPDVCFSDGNPLTARAMADCLTPGDIGAEEIVVNGNEILFILKQPNPLFPLMLAAPYCGIFSRSHSGFLGTGPFSLAAPPSDDVIRLERNDRYRDEVALDEIQFVHIRPDDDGRPTRLLEAISKGEIHITNGLSRSDVSPLHGVRKSFKAENSVAILHFNSRRLTDRHLRKALALAIDRRAIAALSYDNPLAFIASGLMPPAFPQIPDRHRTSLTNAKAELDLCAQTIPRKLTLLEVFSPRPYLPHPHLVSDEIRRQLQPLGFEVEIVVSTDFEDFYTKCQEAEFDLVVGGWIADTNHPADFIEANLGSKFIPTKGARPGYRFNLGGYQSAEVDQAIDEYRSGNTAEARYVLSERLAGDTPLLALMYGPSVVVYLPSVQGFRHDAMGDHLLVTIDLVDP